VTGTYFEDNQEAPRVAGAGEQQGVARYALDREAAERLWLLGNRALA
jgi:hypothetical protein